ncbi:hypothetical protein AVEN_105599-1, partial [Araneus ventricosus]
RRGEGVTSDMGMGTGPTQNASSRFSWVYKHGGVACITGPSAMTGPTS